MNVCKNIQNILQKRWKHFIQLTDGWKTRRLSNKQITWETFRVMKNNNNENSLPSCLKNQNKCVGSNFSTIFQHLNFLFLILNCANNKERCTNKQNIALIAQLIRCVLISSIFCFFSSFVCLLCTAIAWIRWCKKLQDSWRVHCTHYTYPVPHVLYIPSIWWKIEFNPTDWHQI